MKELMIHAWHDRYLDLPLNDYILSFDDGLVSQVHGIKKIIEKFPTIEIRYYISTGIINVGLQDETYNESDVAHLRFKDGITSDFVTYTDLRYLSSLPQVTIGLHGHMHLDIDHIKHNHSLNQYYLIIENDVKEMLFGAIHLFELGIIKNDVIHFCAPYNAIHNIYIALMRKQFAMYFPKAEFVVTGPEREDIFKFNAVSFNDRYYGIIDKATADIVEAMRVPPIYLNDLKEGASAVLSKQNIR